MAQEAISQLDTGTPQGTDLTPATDTTDTSESANGTTKKYIRSDELNFYLEAQGLTTYQAVRVATTLALTVTYANGASGVGATLTNAGAQAALALDGVTLAVGNRVLVKDQASTLQNGIYTVTSVGSGATNWVMTRATDFNEASEIIQYAVVLVNQGTVNAGLLYQETAAGPFTIGTSPITFGAYSTQSLSLPLSLTDGGTGASLVASLGGIFYSGAATGAILAGTATANQVLMSGSSAAPFWSTATYPGTIAVNQMMYASSSNVIGVFSSTAGGVLVSNASSVPSFLTNPSATGRFLQSVSGTTPIWSTAAFPTSVGAVGTILRSDGTNWVATTATYPATTTINQILYSSSANVIGGVTAATGGVLVSSAAQVPSFLANPAAANKILVSVNGDAPAWSTATYPPTAGTAGTILRSDGTNWVNTTATYPSTSGTAGTLLASNGTNWVNTVATYPGSTTQNQLLYSSSANTVAGLATANSAVLVTNSSGAPAWSATMTDGQVIIGDTSGTPVAATLTQGTGIGITNGAGTIEISTNSFNAINIQTFTSDGTYTPHADMAFCIIECVGGGGGGGGHAATGATECAAAGGGGGGEYTRSYFTAIEIGVSQAVTVGAGGAGGAAGQNNGTAGEATAIGVIQNASGGSGGTGSPANVNGDTRSGGAGGTGGTGDYAAAGATGARGRSGGTGLSASAYFTLPGAGGGSVYGNGGTSTMAIAESGATLAQSNGTGYGGGGTGAGSTLSSSATAGGDGSSGVVIVTEYLNT